MQTAKRIPSDLMTAASEDGRDELNLAEFPLGTLAHRLRPGQKTLRFEDRVWDERRGETITRQLTITGADAYGLPTALDDEVLLGLIQLTKLRGFADRKVPFTRYQLIGLLGWRDETKSYQRLEASLNRWTGVTLSYRNAWWHKPRQCWVDETFHVLDNVRLWHRGDRGARRGESAEDLSTFVWNEVLFRSFQAGNVKGIDFEFIKELDSAVAKRLYRFLDKRFFHRTRWQFDLHELAWEHIGLARCYDAASLKRRLRPAIGELEQKGFLEALGEAERFRRTDAGQWQVAFARSAQSRRKPMPTTTETLSAPNDALMSELVRRGVTPSAARQAVGQFAAERIQAQLEVFDWLVARADPKVTRNPPGFLMSAIKEGYQPPRDFVSRGVELQRIARAAERKRQLQARRRQSIAKELAAEHDQQQEIEGFWASLSEEQRLQMEAEAIEQAPALQRRLIARGGRGGAAARKLALDRLALKQLAARLAKPTPAPASD